MRRLSLLTTLSIASLIAVPTAKAHPRFGGAVRAVGHAAYRGGCYRAPCRYYGRSSCYRPYCRSWGFGFGYSPVYYGGIASAPVVYDAAPVVERPGPPPEITQWSDEDLRNMAGDKFTATRGLDPEANRVSIELVNKEYHDETGALIKAKFKVRWVEFKISHSKDGREIREEKAKSTTVKLKFDELGRFTQYDD